MRRRALLAATATALTVPLVAGCTRDDGGDGGGGGGGPYGMVGTGGADMAAEGDEPHSNPRRGGRPALGPEPGEETGGE